MSSIDGWYHTVHWKENKTICLDENRFNKLIVQYDIQKAYAKYLHLREDYEVIHITKHWQNFIWYEENIEQFQRNVLSMKGNIHKNLLNVRIDEKQENLNN